MSTGAKRAILSILLVLSPLLVSAGVDQGQGQIRENALAKRVLEATRVQYSDSVWSSVIPNLKKPYDFMLITDATSGTSEHGEGVPAMLAISCIQREAGATIFFDGVNEVLPMAVQVDVSFNGHEPETYFGTPLPARDTVGLFRFAAHYFVRDIQKTETIEISLPLKGLSWTFDVEGLDKALMRFGDDCALVHWKIIDPLMLVNLMLELHRQPVKDSDFEKDMTFLSDLFNQESSEKEDSDAHKKTFYRRLQEILRKLN